MTVLGVLLQAGSSPDFSLTSVPALPCTLAYGESADVEVTFSPSAEGYLDAVLQVVSDDPTNGTVAVPIGGMGVRTEIPPLEQVSMILDFYDESIDIARAMDDPTFITVNANSKYQTIEDLIAASKEKPLNWGVSVLGSTEHIGLAQLAEAAGFEYKAVPFESGGQMVNALMSGAIDATLPNVSEARQQIMDGAFRALVVMAPKRLSGYPDIPTTYEKGYEVDCSTTRGYAVLKGTPMDRVKILSDGLVKGMQHEVFANYLNSAGLTVEESVAGHEVWDAQLKKEYAKAEEAVEKLGFK